jgi:signal transduction histidine kinase
LRPLAAMVDTISSWAPGRTGQRLSVDAAAPREAAVIAAAFNEYLDNLERVVERERAFLNMASHELRTPIAVIAGSAEVALDAPVEPSAVRPSLERILRTARDMERLVALLLALAKDPARLRAVAEPVALGVVVPSIVDDHRYLAEPKDLAFQVVCSEAASIHASSQIVRAAIGNLVRNAIENSDRGIIRIEVTGTRVVIADPGHGMSDAEMAATYTRLARAGTVAGGGIGLDLIARLCAHLGWTLAFESRPEGGTAARLDFGAPAI